MCSFFVGVELSAEATPEHIDNHKAYVQSWIEEIRDKPESIIRAIKDAEAAANYMDMQADQITRLRKKKNSLWGKCPFCNDKGKHFGVKEGKQLYYCFNCRRAGDVISLYKDMKGVTYGTAVRELAELNGVDLGEKKKKRFRKFMWRLGGKKGIIKSDKF